MVFTHRVMPRSDIVLSSVDRHKLSWRKENKDYDKRLQSGTHRHLGCGITEDCKCREEVKCRTATGKEVLSERGELLRGKMEMELKKRAVKTGLQSRYCTPGRKHACGRRCTFSDWNHVKEDMETANKNHLHRTPIQRGSSGYGG